MPTVFIPALLKELTGGVDHLVVEAETVGQAVTALEKQFPGIERRLCDGEELSSNLQVSIDEAISTQGLLAKVKPDSEIHFIPAIGGG